MRVRGNGFGKVCNSTTTCHNVAHNGCYTDFIDKPGTFVRTDMRDCLFL